MHQSITPSLSQTIWPRWASRQFPTLSIVKTLLPVTFGYSLGSQAVVMRQLRRWKRLWRRSLTRSHKRTSIGFPEVVGMVQQVHCSQRRLVRRGLEFHVCTINKSAHTKKFGNLFHDPRIYGFCKFVIKVNFAIDHKVRSELFKKKQDLFTHLLSVWVSLSLTFFDTSLERMLKICSTVINVPDGFFWWKEYMNLLWLKL